MSNLDEFVSRSNSDVDRARAARRRDAGGRPSRARRRRCAPARRVLPRDGRRPRARAPALPRRSGRARVSNSSSQRGRHVVYNAPTSRDRCRRVRRRHGYWRRVRERPGAARDRVPVPRGADVARAATGRGAIPGPAGGLVPEPVPVGHRNRARRARASGSSVDEAVGDRASQIFTNNITVTFLAFAGGMLLGARHAVRAAAERRAARRGRAGSRSARATAGRSSSSSPRTACSS